MDEPDADNARALRPDQGTGRGRSRRPGAKRRPDATTGAPTRMPEPRSRDEEPWQVRKGRELVHGLASQEQTMRAARRQLGLFWPAASGRC